MLNKFEYKGAAVAYQYYQQQAAPAGCLVFIHGFASRGTVFNFQVEALKDQFHILVADLPGSGASELNPHFNSLEDYAALMLALMDHVGLEQVFVFGHSMGGYIALSLAQICPERIRGLGLVHSTAFADNEEKKINRMKAIRLMERHGVAPFLKTMIPALFGEAFKAAHPESIDALLEENMDFKAATLQHYYQIMHDRLDRTDLLKSLPMPFLFVSGSEDKAAPATDLIQQASLPRAAMIEILAGAGHMGLVEQPEKLTQILASFTKLVKSLKLEQL